MKRLERISSETDDGADSVILDGGSDEMVDRPVDTEKLQNLVAGMADLVEEANIPGEIPRPQRRWDVRKETHLLFIGFMECFGISPLRIASALHEGNSNKWREPHMPGGQRERRYYLSGDYMLTTMRRMLTLEQQAPGAVRYLYTQRGVRNFSRYSAEFWKRQYVERDSTLPYMLVITPSGVEKGTVAGTRLYSKLQDGLKTLDQPHVMRIIEVYELQDMLRQLVRLNKTHNVDNSNPIKLVLFDGHGSNERLFLRWGTDKDSKFGNRHISTARFQLIFHKYLSTAFARTAQFIFGSCESALKQEHLPVPVAYTLKKVLHDIFSQDVRIVGSEESVTPFTRLDPSLDEAGALSLECETAAYEDEDRSGKSITVKPRFKNL